MTCKATHNKEHPRLKEIRKLTSRSRLIYYMNQRYEIKLRRQYGASFPWTHDPILQTYRFTNVKRKWDRTSQWLTKHWYRPYYRHPHVGLWAAMARFFNIIPTFIVIGPPTYVTEHWWTRTYRLLKRRRERGIKLFTGAHMIHADAGGQGLLETVLFDYVQPAWNTGLLTTQHHSAYMMTAQLHELHGWGDFITQEAVLDLTETWILGTAPDRTHYAFPGPGCRRGLQRLYSLPSKPSIEHSFAFMQDALQMLRQHQSLHADLRSTLTLHDVEFNLCEFDKYERTLLNQNTPRQRYPIPPET